MANVQIDVVSDVMCPWCYIGKKRLEQAIGELDGEIAVDVNWRPFQLDPTLPPEGRDRREYLEAKFGGSEGAKKAYAAIVETGRTENIAFDFEAIEVSPNTLDAHRLIRWAASAGDETQGRLVDALFRMYFTQGRNIGDHAVLLEAAREAGMDTAIVEGLLKGDADRDTVTEEIAIAQKMGVTGVPCFIIDQRYAVMGAQDPATLADAIRQTAAEKATAKP